MLELRALGNAEIETDKATLTPSQEIVFASALYLILERERRVSRSALAELLWPSVREPTRGHRLRQTLLQLKKLGFPVVADLNQVRLSTQEVRTDVDRSHTGENGEFQKNHSLEFLPGYSPLFSEPFRDWVDATRGEVHSVIARSLLPRIQRARESGEWALVEEYTTNCLSLDPYNEIAVLAKAEATAMRGAKREAVGMLDQYIEDVGSSSQDLKLPATLLRRRISARIEQQDSVLLAEPSFVGREAEMKILTEAVTQAREGNGSAWLVTGDPGIGKSRLARELSSFAELQGVRVQRVSCRRSDVDRPLSVFVDLVPPLRDMPGALGCSQETLFALKRLTEFDGRGTEALLPLEDLTSLYGNMRRALLDLLDALVDEQCLLIVVDDVQWLDRASSGLFTEMTRWAMHKKLLFLFNSRPRDTLALGNMTLPSGLATLELSPLSRDPSLRLLHATLETQSHQADDETLRWLLTAGDGNPFFLQELAKRWLETGHKQEMPPSLATVLTDRLSRLTPDAINVLQACAVLGENSTLDRVEGVLEYKSHQLLTAIQELSVAGMLAPPGLPSDEWAGPIHVRHDLLSIAAVARLAPMSLAFLHRRSGSVLEREISGEKSPTSILWACAFHWGNAGDRGRALAVARSCAEHLLEVGLPTDAARAFERALEYCMTDEDRLGVYSRLVVALQMDSHWEQSKELLIKCRRLRQKIAPDANQHDDVEIRLFDATWKASLENRTLLSELQSCVESHDASAEHRVSCGLLGLKVASEFGEPAVIKKIHSTIEPLLEMDGVPEIMRFEVEMVFHSMCSDPEPALQGMEKFLSAARTERNPLAFARALGNAAVACGLAGRTEKAAALFAEALQYSVSHGLSNRAAAAGFSLVRLLLASADVQEARRVMDRVAGWGPTAEDVHFNADRIYLSAKLALAEGDILGATTLYEAAKSVLSPNQSGIRRAAVLSLGVRIGIKAGLPPEVLRETVDQLQATHLTNRTNGGQDFEAASLFLGLRAIGMADKAAALLREYAETHRREKGPLPQEIDDYLRAPDQRHDDSTCYLGTDVLASLEATFSKKETGAFAPVSR